MEPTRDVVVTFDTDDISEISAKVNEYLEECSDGTFKCTLCGKTSGINPRKSVMRQTIQRHIETHMEGLSYTCSVCQKSLRSRRGFLRHMSVYHKQSE